MENKKFSKALEILLIVIFSLLGLFLVIFSYLERNKLQEWLVYVLMIIGTIFLLICLLDLFNIINKSHKLTIKEMSIISIQSALTVILYYFVKFNIPFFPSWLDIQVSEVPSLITGFIYGPFAGSIVILIRFLLKLPATITAGVGELADLLLGLFTVITSSLIYKKHKSIKGAICSLAISTIGSTFFAMLLNYCILIPAYINIAKFPLEALVGMIKLTPVTVTKENFMLIYIFINVLPFNLIRYLLVSIITFVLYKKTHQLISIFTK